MYVLSSVGRTKIFWTIKSLSIANGLRGLSVWLNESARTYLLSLNHVDWNNDIGTYLSVGLLS